MLLSCIKKLAEVLNLQGKAPQTWQCNVFASLVVLHMTQARVLTRRFLYMVSNGDEGQEYDRGENYPPFLRKDPHPPFPPPNFSDESDTMRLAWHGRLPKGLCCLVYGVYMASDERGGRSLDVSDELLDMASSHRAYSYIRTCLIPLLQTGHDYLEEDLRIDLFESLCDLLRPVVYILKKKRDDEGKTRVEQGRNKKQSAVNYLGTRDKYKEEKSNREVFVCSAFYQPHH